MKIEYYKTLLNETVTELDLLQQKSDRISQLRCIVALVILISMIFGFNKQNSIGYFVGAIFVCLFIILVAQHNKIDDKQKYNSSKKTVIEKYVCRFSDDWHCFTDNGKEYLTEDIPQSRDLDIFGSDSLYQYICIANTPYGRDILAKQLLNPSPSRESVLSCQESVKELSEKKRFSLKIQSLSNLLKDKHNQNNHNIMEKFIEEAEIAKVNNSKFLKIAIWVLPFFTLIMIILTLFGINSESNLIIVMICMFFQSLIVVLCYKRNVGILNPILLFYSNIIVYESIFMEIEQMTFDCDHLRKLQADLKKNMGAVKSLKKLDNIGDAVKVRYNGIVYIVCNLLLMWDFHCVDNFDLWKQVYGSNIRRWLEIVGEIEALLSISVLCDVKENYCFPTIDENSKPTLKFACIKHPLIQEALAVENSLGLDVTTCVITGSNMSGKTTFLRSVGINLVLAYAGAPVLADSFEASIMTIFTSMRIEDSVSKGISTFYAEILRIKQMVEYSQKSIPMISLIDEIFKGTNSADRIIGATEAIKKLAASWSITIVSTHDFELCNLEEDSKICAVNYHFSEYYIGNEIHFDYKIKNGRCKTTNAQHLLKMAGIL